MKKDGKLYKLPSFSVVGFIDSDAFERIHILPGCSDWPLPNGYRSETHDPAHDSDLHSSDIPLPPPADAIVPLQPAGGKVGIADRCAVQLHLIHSQRCGVQPRLRHGSADRECSSIDWAGSGFRRLVVGDPAGLVP